MHAGQVSEHSRKNGDVTEPRLAVSNRKHNLEVGEIAGKSPAIEDRFKITAIEPAGLAALAYLPDRVDRPPALWRRIANVLHDVAEREADERLLIMAAGPAATRQLRTRLPDGFTAAPGTEFTLRIQAALRNRLITQEHAVSPDLDLLLVDRREQGSRGSVLTLGLTKRR